MQIYLYELLEKTENLIKSKIDESDEYEHLRETDSPFYYCYKTMYEYSIDILAEHLADIAVTGGIKEYMKYNSREFKDFNK